MADFDLIVVGAGMFGSAAARHAVASGARVALVGPGEPGDHTVADGPFASHFDEGRITRRLDPDPDWALIADRAIGRYEALADQTGRAFHKRCGVLMFGPETPDGSSFGSMVTNTRATCAQMGLQVDDLTRDDLMERFPQFAYEDGFAGLFEAGDAGVINPRAMVRAQIEAATRNGATRVDQAAMRIDEGQVTCADGTVLRAPKIVVAAGIYTSMSGLLPQELHNKVVRRTVTLFEISGDEAERLAELPTAIFAPRSRDCEPYLLPPVRYPDGKLWLKIGGEPEDHILTNADEATDWFRAGGCPDVMEFQTQMITDLMPGLRFDSHTTKACAYTKTTSLRPIVQEVSEGVIACFGGNGMGAKGSDEIGRIGAHLALHGAVPDGYDGNFRADAPPSPNSMWPGTE